MYKPPTNSNRVKTIKNKFEGFDSTVSNNNNNGKESAAEKSSKIVATSRSNLAKVENGKPPLNRQLSDPCKRNIKRTPAFRLDKSHDNQPPPFQRNHYCNRSTTFENKVKQFNSAVKCDSANLNSDKCLNINNNKSPQKNKLIVSDRPTKSANKPILIKSKSSADFQYIRNKFCIASKTNDQETANQQQTKEISNRLTETKSAEKLNNICQKNNKAMDFSMLYTEPIPKALRKKNCDIKENDIYNMSTLKIGDKMSKLQEIVDLNQIGLTDTLKTALKRPLPPGPAPKKPPRTFQHLPLQNNLETNPSFLHTAPKTDVKVHVKKSPALKKADPKYMLSKLENALKNNKLKSRKQAKIDLSTTSGEDSDDSLLFKSKSLPKTTLNRGRLDEHFAPKPPAAFDLNCLNGFNCVNSNYEKLNEPMSSFFVDRHFEEPVYAEPFHHGNNGSNENKEVKRNSLYYMSSPVQTPEENYLEGSMKNGLAAEISSTSSFTSDTDSICSISNEDSTPTKVRDIVGIFQSSPPTTRPQQQDSDRVENLRNNLKKTLERSFSSGARPLETSANGNVKDIVEKFQHYIKQVPKYCEPKFTKTDPLFHCCLIVQRSQDIAQIKYKFPPGVDVPCSIEKLVFPETHMVTLDSTSTAQNYSMILTDDKAERMFGYCRRVMPEGTSTCLPLAYCILSKHRSPRFYKKVLIELESRHGFPDKTRDELICQFYLQSYPLPGMSVLIDLTRVLHPPPSTSHNNNLEESLDLSGFVNVHKTGQYGVIQKKGDKIFVSEHDADCVLPSIITENGDKVELELTLHPDRRYEVTDLTSLHRLPDDVILKIFSSLLLERKVILISTVLSDLSLTVDALQSILYPFEWPHTVIPVLPESLWPVVESPTPVICGCLSRAVVEEHFIENGIVVDLDRGAILKCEGDEDKILSNSIKKAWKKSLSQSSSKKLILNGENLGNSMEYTRSKCLSDAYLQVFAMSISHYKNHLENGEFRAKEFVQCGKTKGIRKFLVLFTQTFMFNEFISTASPEKISDFDRSLKRIMNK
ncbi:unnamed protein product [Brassicogethes aeneus]|uniref:UDENN domain-containing protein n=1 Tax=Brassicogethes aeneus TaxID=1431903 RepID=A0A9P0B2I8_BRAAE|nr:unnamed protein product [Brassicogethes aeneus]